MGFEQRWITYTKSMVQNVENRHGVYVLANVEGRPLYLGAGRVRDQLVSHYPGLGDDPIAGVSQFRYRFTDDREEARRKKDRLLEKFKRKRGTLPQFNEPGGSEAHDPAGS